MAELVRSPYSNFLPYAEGREFKSRLFQIFLSWKICLYLQSLLGPEQLYAVTDQHISFHCCHVESCNLVFWNNTIKVDVLGGLAFSCVGASAFIAHSAFLHAEAYTSKYAYAVNMRQASWYRPDMGPYGIFSWRWLRPKALTGWCRTGLFGNSQNGGVTSEDWKVVKK